MCSSASSPLINPSQCRHMRKALEGLRTTTKVSLGMLVEAMENVSAARSTRTAIFLSETFAEKLHGLIMSPLLKETDASVVSYRIAENGVT